VDMNRSQNAIMEYYFGKSLSVAAKILFIKRNARLSEYKEYLTDCSEFGNVWRGVTGKLRGEKISIIATGIGPSLVGDCVYALDRPGAVCLYSGTCGGLHTSLEIGDYFIAHRAVCGDGFTLHLGYSPMAITTGDPELIRSLSAALCQMVPRLDEGLSFTTSSIVREADCDFWDVVDKQCRIIEMGAAPFYAAAQATCKRAAAYFWVTDLPTSGKNFFDALSPADIQAKQRNYDSKVLLDLELLVSLEG